MRPIIKIFFLCLLIFSLCLFITKISIDSTFERVECNKTKNNPTSILPNKIVEV